MIVSTNASGQEKSPDSSSIQNLDPITVRAPEKTEMVSVEKSEQVIGLEEDISDLIFSQPGIKRVPESGSSLLIRGEGPYDCQFFVHSIAVLPPSHYIGVGQFDRSSTFISSMKTLSVITEKIPGRFYNTSGGCIMLGPDIGRFASKKLLKRSEISGHISLRTIDLSLSSPFRRRQDFYQISTRFISPIHLNMLVGRYWETFYKGYLGRGCPGPYTDFVFTGQTRLGSRSVREFLSFSVDSYLSTYPGVRDTVLPWAIASVNLFDTLSGIPFQLTTGGATQYYFEGKRYGSIVPLRSINRTDASIRCQAQVVETDNSTLSVAVQSQRLLWRGKSQLFEINTMRIIPGLSIRRRELDVILQSSLTRFGQSHTYGINLIGGCLNQPLNLFCDPGVWFEKTLSPITLLVEGGVTTSQPDIRGLPEDAYREKQIKTTSLSVNMKNLPLPASTSSLGMYGKWKNHCPKFSRQVAQSYWDPMAATPLAVAGCDLSVHTEFTSTVSAQSMASFSRSLRYLDGGFTTYEWDIPWLVNSTLAYSPNYSNSVWYITAVFAAGLPYFDVGMHDGILSFDSKTKRVKPWYRRIDVKWQVNNDVTGHRFFTRYEGYVEFANLISLTQLFQMRIDQNIFNVQEYFWDSNLQKRSILCDYFSINLGIRVGFRL